MDTSLKRREFREASLALAAGALATAGFAAQAPSAGSVVDCALAQARRMCGTKTCASISTVSAWIFCMSASDTLPPFASFCPRSWVTRPARKVS